MVYGNVGLVTTGFFTQLLEANRKVGELETKLLQLEEPGTTNVEFRKKLEVKA